jgi:hypothetical protein
LAGTTVFLKLFAIGFSPAFLNAEACFWEVAEAVNGGNQRETSQAFVRLAKAVRKRT